MKAFDVMCERRRIREGRPLVKAVEPKVAKVKVVNGGKRANWREAAATVLASAEHPDVPDSPATPASQPPV